ncbi:MAG: DUF885 family protein [Candidatus Marinimicrobia bacterium]|nr:DUF885 family protein [Candidatus Neomarinimicrobiota bacterium]
MKFALLFLVVHFFSCSQSYVKSYTDLESAFTDWYFKFHPVQSTQYGSHEYNFSFQRLDNDAREEYLADVQRFSIELSQIDETKLPETEYVNYNVLTKFLSAEVYSLQSERRFEWDVSLYPKMIYDGIIALVDLDYLDMNARTNAIERRLAVSTSVLDDAYENLKFNSVFHQKKTSEIINALHQLLNELPLKVMSDNQTLDKIDSHIIKLRRELEMYEDWVEGDYSSFDIYEIEKTPEALKTIFAHVVGGEYSISKISQLAEKRIHKIQNQIFDLSLPFYLQKNDEPVWVDRDDSLSVIYWVMGDIGENKINPEEYISSVYASSKKVHDALRKNRDLFITPIPNIQIRFDDEYSISSNFARVERFQLNNDNKGVEYLVKPINDEIELESILNRFELDIMVMKDLSPGDLQLQQSLTKNSQLLRQIIQNDVTQYGWQQYVASYMIYSGFGGGENYAYALTSLFQGLQIAGLSWAELQIGYHESAPKQVINMLSEKNNISKEDAKTFVENIGANPFQYTQQFIGGIEMERLLADYKRKNENAVNMREFHAKILNEGSIPISQLRKMILN